MNPGIIGIKSDEISTQEPGWNGLKVITYKCRNLCFIRILWKERITQKARKSTLS